MKRPSRKGATVEGKAPPQVYSTTLGRAKFPEFIQMSYGEKAVIGFDRYGHVLGAIVPIEAVKMLAGREEELKPLTRQLIADSAKQLLAQAPPEMGLSGFAGGAHQRAPRSTIEIEEMDARRRKRTRAQSRSAKQG